jgi:hypothetical protein
MKRKSLITKLNLSPGQLFVSSMFFLIIFVLLNHAGYGTLITVVPDALFLFLFVDSIATKIRNTFFRNEYSKNYYNLINSLNKVKHGKSDLERKKYLSLKLINIPDLLTAEDRADLIDQVEEIYASHH